MYSFGIRELSLEIGGTIEDTFDRRCVVIDAYLRGRSGAMSDFNACCEVEWSGYAAYSALKQGCSRRESEIA